LIDVILIIRSLYHSKNYREDHSSYHLVYVSHYSIEVMRVGSFPALNRLMVSSQAYTTLLVC